MFLVHFLKYAVVYMTWLERTPIMGRVVGVKLTSLFPPYVVVDWFVTLNNIICVYKIRNRLCRVLPGNRIWKYCRLNTGVARHIDNTVVAFCYFSFLIDLFGFNGDTNKTRTSKMPYYVFSLIIFLTPDGIDDYYLNFCFTYLSWNKFHLYTNKFPLAIGWTARDQIVAVSQNTPVGRIITMIYGCKYTYNKKKKKTYAYQLQRIAHTDENGYENKCVCVCVCLYVIVAFNDGRV